jgi:hypothetical protein
MSEPTSDLRLEIAHVLFIDIVGYSEFLINEQHELLQKLNQIVRGTEAFRDAETAGRLIRFPTGDGMALVFSTPRMRRCDVRWKSARRCRATPSFRCEWASIAGQ